MNANLQCQVTYQIVAKIASNIYGNCYAEPNKTKTEKSNTKVKSIYIVNLILPKEEIRPSKGHLKLGTLQFMLSYTVLNKGNNLK